MCGRYALYQRPSVVRRQLEEANMPVDDAPGDEDVRQSYNFAPGYVGLVYHADAPEPRAADSPVDGAGADGVSSPPDEVATKTAAHAEQETSPRHDARYKLQAMKWGLVPFWTKRNPNHGSTMKTINCRDDSLLENRGMWTSMKHKKRCVVVCQGFYEWLKKNGGKEKIPHFVKRKDGQPMCFAGLWDCVQFEGSEEKLYTYTIITTDSNKQLKFLHDRMPVILENGSDELRTWLSPERTEWSKELQALLRPYQGELECYPVSKEVGKVGNNSPAFIVPVDSAENKSNIANFFGKQKQMAKVPEVKKELQAAEEQLTSEGIQVHQDRDETRETTKHESTEDNAPLPGRSQETPKGVKREHEEDSRGESDTADDHRDRKARRTTTKEEDHTPSTPRNGPLARTRSATSNGTQSKTGSAKKKKKKKTETAGAGAGGSQKITAFFGK